MSEIVPLGRRSESPVLPRRARGTLDKSGVPGEGTKSGEEEEKGYLECNLGKGAKVLSDLSAVELQKRQLDELNERRLQLEMMLAWREGLAGLEQDAVDIIVRRFEEASGRQVLESGRKEIQ